MATPRTGRRRGLTHRAELLAPLSAEVIDAQATFLRMKRPAPLPAPATPLQHAAPVLGEREETVH